MFLRNAFAVVAAATVLAPAGRAQAVTWATPVLGYFFDGGSGSIKTIAGVPGAASLESVVPSGIKLQRAYIAPGRKFAVASTLDEGTVLLDWSSGETIVRPVPGAIGDVTAVAFSSNGAAAAILSRSAGKIQVWRSLPDNARVQEEIASEASAVAVADDGSVATIKADGVFLFESGEARQLASGDYSAIAFRPGTNTVAAAGRFSDSVVMFQSGGETSTLSTADDGVAEPAGLHFSSDATKLVIANRRGRSATIVDLASGSSTTIGCDCDAVLVSPAAANAIFRLTDSPDQPITFLDASTAEPRTFVVPVTGGSR